jgi:toxin-antitoxin system, antitoxin component, PHD family
MIIKSSTALRNNYGMISDLAHEKAEQREETLKLRAKLEAAETARISGAPAYTLEESKKRMEAIYQCD